MLSDSPVTIPLLLADHSKDEFIVAARFNPILSPLQTIIVSELVRFICGCTVTLTTLGIPKHV